MNETTKLGAPSGVGIDVIVKRVDDFLMRHGKIKQNSTIELPEPLELLRELRKAYVAAMISLDSADTAHDCLKQTSEQLSKRTARLQVLRENMTELQWRDFCYDYPQAIFWFDNDNVPT